jgi:predicted GIY-YIG superfamily endonuclease
MIKESYLTDHKMPIDMLEHARWNYVYRLFSANDELLYVGITTDPYVRWRQHQRNKPWADEVTHYLLQRFAYPDLAAAAESRAISNEQPKYNVKGTDEHNNTMVARMLAGRAKQKAMREQDHENVINEP